MKTKTKKKLHRWLALGRARGPLAGLALGASAGLAQAQAQATGYDVLVNHDLYLQETAVAGTTVDNGPVGAPFVLRAKVQIVGASGSLGPVQLTERLPEGAIFQGYTPPAGASCIAPPTGMPITAANAAIECTLSTVTTAPSHVDFRIVLPSESTAWKAYASTAAVPGNNDTNPGNNQDIERGITTYARADLAVAFTAPAAGSAVLQGDVVNYVAQVRNADSLYAFDLKAGEKAVLRFNQPAGTQFQGSPTGAGWSCQSGVDSSTTPTTSYWECAYTVPTGTVVAKNTPLPPITFPVLVVNTTGTITAQASVVGQISSGTAFAESVWSNNIDSVSVTATPNLNMDMALSKSVDKLTLDADAGANVPVTYTLAVSRVSGTINPADVTVVDTLPAGVSYAGLDASSSNWACSPSGQVITCTYSGSLALGNNPASIQDLKINALVAQSALVNSAALQNTGVLTVSNETEPVGANNTATVTSTVRDNANLQVRKTSSASVVASGTAYYYDIAVSNNGPLDVRVGQTITITDDLDDRLEFVGVDGSSPGWSCTPSGGTGGTPNLGALLSCTNSSGIENGQASTLRLNVIPHLPSGGNQFAVITNTANLTGVDGRDPFTTIPAPSPDVNLSQKVADLSITKTAAITAGNTYGDDASGSEVVYTLKVKNTDPNPALGEVQTAQTVVVTDTVNHLINSVRAAAAGVSTYQPGGRYLMATVAIPGGSAVTADACTLSGSNSTTSSTVRCVLRNVPVDADAEYTITIRARQYVDPTNATTQTREISNTASVSSTDTAEYSGPGAQRNSDTARVTLRALADMAIMKTPNPSAAAAGQDIGYVLTARNNGPSQAVDVKVEDRLPVGALWVSQPVRSSSSGDTGTCTLGDGMGATTPIVIGAAVQAPNNHLVCNWTRGFNLAGQQTVEYHLRSVTKDAPAQLDNTVTVSTATPETDDTNNRAEATVTLGASQVDVQINMQHSADAIPLNNGDTQYTIKVTNSGASTSYATGVVMTETFPAANTGATFAFVSLDSVESSDASHAFDPSACTAPAVGATAGQLVCSFPWLKPGESVDIKFTMRPVAILGGRPTGTIFHSATVVADVEQLAGQDVGANNATTDRTSTYDPAQVSNPDALKFIDLSITKDATGYPAEGVQVGDTIAYTLVVKNEEDPAAVPSLDLEGGQAVVEDVLPAGLALDGAAPAGCDYSDVTRTLRCTITDLQAGASQSYAFTAQVQQLAAGQDSIDNMATVTSPGDPKEANNTSEKKVPSLSGFDLALTKSVNQAQAQAGDTLTYTLVVTNHGPAGSPAGQISDPLPAGLGFAASADGCTAAGTVVNCTVPALAAQASQTFTFTARIEDTVSGPATLANTATVSANGDTDEGNNHGTATTEVPAPNVPTPPVKPQQPTPTPVPTLAQWSQMLLAGLLALMGWVALRRRAN